MGRVKLSRLKMQVFLASGKNLYTQKKRSKFWVELELDFLKKKSRCLPPFFDHCGAYLILAGNTLSHDPRSPPIGLEEIDWAA